MDNTVKQEMCKVENYEYESDFQLLTLKEKRGILRNSRILLNLQKENDIFILYSSLLKKENEKFEQNGT